MRQKEVSPALLKVSSPLWSCSLAQIQGKTGREFSRLILPSIFGKCVSSQPTRENTTESVPQHYQTSQWDRTKESWADSFLSTLFVGSLVLSKLTLPSFLTLSWTSQFTKHFHIHFLSRTLWCKPGRYWCPYSIYQKTENFEGQTVYSGSQLARALPVPEACSFGVKPTSGSVTTQMAHKTGFLIISKMT